MEDQNSNPGRRHFLRTATTFSVGLTGLMLFPQTGCSQETSRENDLNIIGPKAGYSPQIGTLVSMLNWMRHVVLGSVQNLNQQDLDHLYDPEANTIGAMLMHLAATEAWYQAVTFNNQPDYNAAEKAKWGAAMNLGIEGRKKIKGRNLNYYLDLLQEVRNKTLQELRKRDDAWLMQVDEKWSWGPTNNYCKWFHVCEHESNHNGQIKWIKSRLPRTSKR